MEAAFLYPIGLQCIDGYLPLLYNGYIFSLHLLLRIWSWSPENDPTKW